MIGLLMMLAAASPQMTLADLQAMCVTDRSGCSLYILGVTEGINLAAGLAKDQTRFCVPADVSETELTEVIERLAKSDLAAFPDDRALSASGFIGAALNRQYPCGKRG